MDEAILMRDFPVDELTISCLGSHRQNRIDPDLNHPEVLEKIHPPDRNTRDYSTKGLIDFHLKSGIKLKFICTDSNRDVTSIKLKNTLALYVFRKTSIEVLMAIYKKHYLP